VSPLTVWLTDPVADRGIHLATGGGEWEFVSYAELAEGARRVGAELAAAGVRPGDVVSMLMPTGVPCLTTFFGAWGAGATPSLLAPPSFQASQQYIAQVAAILRQASPALVATCGGYEELVSGATRAAGRKDEPWTYRTGTAEMEPRPPGELAVLQFTSGSTGAQRGVQPSWDNLRANVTMLQKLLGWRGQDGMASWLPLHHDLGLIGCLLTAVSAQGSLWLMQPEQFIRRPLQWLSALQPGRATHSMSPAFAFSYLARRVRPEQLAALDLSGWRTATVGAEVIDPAALSSFARLARVAGFSCRAYRPGYGLAEATLVVTVAARPGEGSLVRADPASLRLGERVRICDTARLTEEPRPARDGWLIGHGRPAPEHEVRLTIVDESGAPLPDGYLGEIVIAGPSVTGGYHGGVPGGATRFCGGQLYSGDAGFRSGSDLFVLGRMGDSLKVNGVLVYVEELDLKVSAATGLDRSRLAVVSAYGAGAGGVVLFAETKPGRGWVEAACAVLQGRLGSDFPITVVAGSRGLIKKTSSGKPRRRYMWQLLQTGELPQTAVVVAASGPARVQPGPVTSGATN
jgi:fatty-acyl-CoA synthase